MIEKSKLLKKVLTVVLSAAMLMSAAAAVPVLPDSGLNTEVQAAETYGNFEYYEDEWENTVTITGYTGTDKVVTIPSKINNRSVTKINIFAFENNTAITKVIIPDSVGICIVVLPEGIPMTDAVFAHQAFDVVHHVSP